MTQKKQEKKPMLSKKMLLLIGAALLLVVLGSVAAIALTGTEEEKTELLTGKHYVQIDIRDYGVITAELYADVAPVTVTNFMKLAEEGFYDGLTFHRIINGFMIQGGDPNGNGTGGSSRKIKGEFSSNGVSNPLAHYRGMLSMARSSNPNSASSQFFIMHQDASHLNGQYAAFGRVISGMEVVDAICARTPVVDGNGTVANGYKPVMNSVKPIVGDELEALLAKMEEEMGELLTGKHYVQIDVQDFGAITAELDADIAPITVTNFMKLAEEGFYDGLTFHRIISGFMIQGGDPNGNGTGGSDRKIKGEFAANGVMNSLDHTRGVLSMARSSSPNSASSQFFIMHQDAPHLNGQYAAFGRVISGMEVVDAICSRTPVTDSNGVVQKASQPVITGIHPIEKP